jgi:tetratricopeptide (TPR) repeat protein
MSPVEETEEPDPGPGADGGEQDGGSLGRWIAVSLAAIAVIGAGIGVLQTSASVDEANTARETTRTAVGALRAGVALKGARLLEQDIEAESKSLSRQQDYLSRDSGTGTPPLGAGELRSILPAGGELPGARTPREINRLAYESERLSLRQSALAETRITWNDRSTQYTTAIAVLALALFLVGFSLVLAGRRRLLFYVFGMVVAVFAVGAAVAIYLAPVPETPDDAIAATAAGKVASDEGNQQRAIALLGEAIELDGDFASPYSRRAVALARRANPDFEATGAVTGSDDVLTAARIDAEKALELGGNRDLLAFSFLALSALYEGEYEKSVEAADGAIGINSEVVDLHFIKSAAEVGLGDSAAALRSLRAASALLDGSDASERTRGLVARYATYLEQVADREPERAGEARRIERRIFEVETGFTLDREISGELPPKGTVEVGDLRYENGEFRLGIQWDDLPAKTAVTLIGFERPAPGGAWVQPRDLSLFRTLGGSGRDSGQVPIERNCTPVEVRVDIYLDGAFLETATGPGGKPTC